MSQGNEHGGERLAPVTFLPGVAERSAPRGAGPRFVPEPEPQIDRGTGWGMGAGATEFASETATEVADPEAQLGAAIDLVARKLRSRGLSEQEVRSALASAGTDRAVIDDAVDALVERGWLSDAVLAEQLVHGAVTRKGMGRRAIQQLLVKRGIARDVIAAVIDELPDDDADRALELARDKARSLVRYDDETATRRLLGMLARRGFGGSQATTAVRTALADARCDAGGGARIVRFE